MYSIWWYGIFFLLFALHKRYVLSIVGGVDVGIKEAPYMVSVVMRGKHRCGGAIINERWVLTAAHCAEAIHLQYDDKALVRIGSRLRDEGGTLYDVEKCFKHEKYNKKNNDYDIGLLKLAKKVTFNDKVKPIALPLHNETADTAFGTICGWGSYRVLVVNLTKDLNCVTLPKVPKETCRQEYKGKYVITDHQVCYGDKAGTKDACTGDSGGPLVNKDEQLIGITSWGDGCAEAYLPGIYTDVIKLVPWILSKILLS